MLKRYGVVGSGGGGWVASRILVSAQALVTVTEPELDNIEECFHLLFYRKFLCFLIPAYLSMSALITSTEHGEGSWIR